MLDRGLKNAESIWTMAEEALSKLKEADSLGDDQSGACEEVRRHTEEESAKFKKEMETYTIKLIEKQRTLTALNKQLEAELQHKKRVIKKTAKFYDYKMEMERKIDGIGAEVAKLRDQFESAQKRYRTALDELQDLSNAIHVKRRSADRLSSGNSLATPQGSIGSTIEQMSSSIAIVGRNSPTSESHDFDSEHNPFFEGPDAVSFTVADEQDDEDGHDDENYDRKTVCSSKTLTENETDSDKRDSCDSLTANNAQDQAIACEESVSGQTTCPDEPVETGSNCSASSVKIVAPPRKKNVKQQPQQSEDFLDEFTNEEAV